MSSFLLERLFLRRTHSTGRSSKLEDATQEPQPARNFLLPPFLDFLLTSTQKNTGPKYPGVILWRDTDLHPRSFLQFQYAGTF